MIKFILKHPGMVCLLLVCVSCLCFGPNATGAWLGSHARALIVGTWHFARALLSSAT
jgi:hypothetical protein